MNNLPWFSDAEVDDLCTGLKVNAAKVRHLESLGLTVKQKPNGRPLVMRSHAENILRPQPTASETELAIEPALPAALPWEETVLGRWQKERRDFVNHRRAERDAQPLPTKDELRAAMREAEHRRKQARAAIVRFHASRRRVAKLQRTPPWANQAAIKAIYADATRLTEETGVMHHVDHIYPLQGKIVSGLHVETNLQILQWRDNIIKRNNFEVAP